MKMTENGHITSINLAQLTQVGNLSDGHDNPSITEGSQDGSLHESIEGQSVDEQTVIDFDLPLQQVLNQVKEVLCNRLDDVENRLDRLGNCCINLHHKVDVMSASIKNHIPQTEMNRPTQTVIVGVPQGPSGKYSLSSSPTPYTGRIGPSVTLITLNTEADFPLGSWLGDENDPELRVRCHITPTDLLHINTTCHTAEKMALTLLDYLFDREVQACSNISGTGKHKKKQLDPLFVYGIRCHLVYKFHITEKDWYRIRQNMDSKCRTAFRRKMKGFSSNGQDSESEHSVDRSSDAGTSELEKLHTISLETGTINLVDESDITAVMEGAQVFHTPEGDIQVLHATPEQIARIQETHQIQILTSDNLLTTADGQIIQEITNETQLLTAAVEDDNPIKTEIQDDQ